MILHVKNMVCDRCKMVVKAELSALGLNPASVELGEILLDKALTAEQRQKVANRFTALGFQLLEDKKTQLTTQIKTLIIQLIHHADYPVHITLSAYLSQQCGIEYAQMSAIFSETEDHTIEQYYIAQKIEKVKEMLAYGELTLSEIAFKLRYSSVAHLSAQFKKVTGLTPTAYKNGKVFLRKPLDKI